MPTSATPLNLSLTMVIVFEYNFNEVIISDKLDKLEKAVNDGYNKIFLGQYFNQPIDSIQNLNIFFKDF